MQRAFNFRLARLSRVREIFEGVARVDFAEALSAQQVIEQRCEILSTAISQGHLSQATAQEARIGALDVRALLARERSIDSLKAELLLTQKKLAQANLQTDRAREAWQARTHDCKALEQLESRERERHQKALFDFENEEMEDAAAQAFSRERKGHLSDTGI